MAENTILIPAADLAARNKARFPNESPEYRQARNDLLSGEIELRRNVERVAALRRALPPGGEIPEDYAFESSNGAVRLSQLFGDKDNHHMTAELSGMADPQYDTREERRVILNYEDPAARQLGESTRSNHGGNPYNVASPTSIVPLPQ